MKKSQFILFVFLIAAQMVGAQKALLKKADMQFAEKDFQTALINYQKLDKIGLKARKNVADSYYFLGQMKLAEAAYDTLFSKEKISDSAFLLRYADAAKANDNYEKANRLLTQYAQKTVNIKQKLAQEAENLPEIYDFQPIKGQSDFTAFGPAFYKDRLVFSSSKNSERPIYKRTQEPFLDLYTAKINGANISDEKLLSGEVNTPLHEGNVTFTRDGKTMYFTRTSADLKRINGVKVAVLQLYRAELVNEQWTNVKKLPINSADFSMAHPALSPDNKTLYFTSDMPGGLGEGDLYSVGVLENFQFGEIKNLGPTVNSEMQEQFPYISDQGNLYFASDRYLGLGGLDLYRSDIKGNSFAEAYNLGTTINSSKDDFSMIVNEEKAEGYFSSNRDQKDKIYYLQSIDNRTRSLNGIVTNSTTTEPVDHAMVSLFDGADQLLKQTETNTEGSYYFDLKPNILYTVKAEKGGYKETLNTLDINRLSPMNLQLNISLKPTDHYSIVNKDKTLIEKNLHNIYFDFDKAEIRQDAKLIMNQLALLLKEKPEIQIGIYAHTDAVGTKEYNQRLSERRAKATKDFLVQKGINANRIMTKGFGETQLSIDINTGNKEAHEQANRRSEFKILKEAKN